MDKQPEQKTGISRRNFLRTAALGAAGLALSAGRVPLLGGTTSAFANIEENPITNIGGTIDPQGNFRIPMGEINPEYHNSMLAMEAGLKTMASQAVLPSAIQAPQIVISGNAIDYQEWLRVTGKNAKVYAGLLSNGGRARVDEPKDPIYVKPSLLTLLEEIGRLKVNFFGMIAADFLGELGGCATAARTVKNGIEGLEFTSVAHMTNVNTAIQRLVFIDSKGNLTEATFAPDSQWQFVSGSGSNWYHGHTDQDGATKLFLPSKNLPSTFFEAVKPGAPLHNPRLKYSEVEGVINHPNSNNIVTFISKLPMLGEPGLLIVGTLSNSVREEIQNRVQSSFLGYNQLMLGSKINTDSAVYDITGTGHGTSGTSIDLKGWGESNGRPKIQKHNSGTVVVGDDLDAYYFGQLYGA
jgi:hypothetical protein